MCRRDDANVDGTLLGAADASDAPSVERAKDGALRRVGQLGDLVEKERAPVRLLEHAGSRRGRSGESTALEAEQRRLHEPRGDRATVDCQEPPRPPRRSMEGSRDDFFPGAGLAADQDGYAGGSHALHERAEPLPHRSLRRELRLLSIAVVSRANRRSRRRLERPRADQLEQVIRRFGRRRIGCDAEHELGADRTRSAQVPGELQGAIDLHLGTPEEGRLRSEQRDEVDRTERRLYVREPPLHVTLPIHRADQQERERSAEHVAPLELVGEALSEAVVALRSLRRRILSVYRVKRPGDRSEPDLVTEPHARALDAVSVDQRPIGRAEVFEEHRAVFERQASVHP